MILSSVDSMISVLSAGTTFELRLEAIECADAVLWELG